MSFHVEEIFDAYRKFKSYVYYDNTSLFLRDKLAAFESQEKFEQNLVDLANNLDSFKSVSELRYFRDLFGQIKYKLLPKKIDFDGYPQNEIVITNRFTDSKYEVSRLTYLIDAPIELHIISILWITNGGYSLEETYKKWNYAYRLNINEKTTRVKNGLNLFQKYFVRYRKWRDNAIHEAKGSLDKKNDVAILGLDLKNYFHSVQLSFRQLNEAFSEDVHSEKFDILTRLLKRIYVQYTRLIDRIDGNERDYNDETLLPVGILSSGIIANWYLRNFDEQIVKAINPLYYGRYVDDILIVISNPDVKKTRTNQKISLVKEYMQKFFVQKKLLEHDIETGEYVLMKFKNLSIQKEKIILYDFDGEESAAVLDKFEKTIKKNSSEFRFLPEDDKVSSEFEDEAHTIIYSGSINKLRSVTSLQHDKYGASKFLAKKIFASLLSSDKKDEKTTSQILSFFKGRITLDFLSLWEKLATYFVINNQPEDFLKFYNEAVKAINSLQISKRKESELKSSDKSILDTLKNDLQKALDISCSMAFSLEPEFLTASVLAELKKLNSNQAKREWFDNKILFFRRSNLIRHNYVFHPLLNYTNYCSNSNKSLVNREVLFNKTNNDYDFKINGSSKKYSPRWIRLFEATLHENNKFINSMAQEDFIAKADITSKRIFIETYDGQDHLIEKAFDTFFDINHPTIKSDDKIRVLPKLKANYYKLEKEEEFDNEIDNLSWEHLIAIGEFENIGKNKLKVAVANLKVSQQNQLASIRQRPNLSRERRLKLFELLNSVNHEGADLFVLPENSVPWVWLDLLVTYAKDNFLGIIVGLEHVIVRNNIAFNFIATILPVRVGAGMDAIIDIRLKNHYAPKEAMLLTHEFRYHIPIPVPNRYTLFNWRNCKFSAFYCYELADITHRALFRSKVDFLVASEYNPDIKYFSNIVESVIRDVHCYFIQANSSDFGDSRISQPKKSELLDILRIKGGDNDTFLVTELDIGDLRNFQNMDIEGQMMARAKNNNIFKLTPPDFNHDEVHER